MGSLVGTGQQRARFHVLRRSVGLQARPLLIAERRERLMRPRGPVTGVAGEPGAPGLLPGAAGYAACGARGRSPASRKLQHC
jgi:hypothetical protein